MLAKLLILVCPAGLMAAAGDPSAASAQEQARLNDIRDVEPDLVVPQMTAGEPAPGKRTRQVVPSYAQTAAYHALYLPEDWKPGELYPVLVEYAGNGGYRNSFGDECTGRPEGSKLGFGLSAGKGYLWICLPYLNAKGEANVPKWWGDAPAYDPAPTVAYCKAALPWICERFGGDPEAIILMGFSRGAIACNYIGLADDEIASLWRAFVPYSHYDGDIESWPYAAADRASALQRLKRLDGRPQFLCSESGKRVTAAQEYLSATGVKGEWTFMATGFRNHNDAWVLRASPAREALRTWLGAVLKESPAGDDEG